MSKPDRPRKMLSSASPGSRPPARDHLRLTLGRWPWERPCSPPGEPSRTPGKHVTNASAVPYRPPPPSTYKGSSDGARLCVTAFNPLKLVR